MISLYFPSVCSLSRYKYSLAYNNILFSVCSLFMLVQIFNSQHHSTVFPHVIQRGKPRLLFQEYISTYKQIKRRRLFPYTGTYKQLRIRPFFQELYRRLSKKVLWKVGEKENEGSCSEFPPEPFLEGLLLWKKKRKRGLFFQIFLPELFFIDLLRCVRTLPCLVAL